MIEAMRKSRKSSRSYFEENNRAPPQQVPRPLLREEATKSKAIGPLAGMHIRMITSTCTLKTSHPGSWTQEGEIPHRMTKISSVSIKETIHYFASASRCFSRRFANFVLCFTLSALRSVFVRYRNFFFFSLGFFFFLSFSFCSAAFLFAAFARSVSLSTSSSALKSMVSTVTVVNLSSSMYSSCLFNFVATSPSPASSSSVSESMPSQSSSEEEFPLASAAAFRESSLTWAMCFSMSSFRESRSCYDREKCDQILSHDFHYHHAVIAGCRAGRRSREVPFFVLQSSPLSPFSRPLPEQALYAGVSLFPQTR